MAKTRNHKLSKKHRKTMKGGALEWLFGKSEPTTNTTVTKPVESTQVEPKPVESTQVTPMPVTPVPVTPMPVAPKPATSSLWSFLSSKTEPTVAIDQKKVVGGKRKHKKGSKKR
jgi:hypothetical protein